jgi:hypothetical protein
MFEGLDVDALLKQRGDSFDADWIRAAEPVQIAWERGAISRADDSLIDGVWEEAFKRTLARSNGDHDLAETVADDFAIICKQALTNVDSEFIARLRAAYDSNRIPA